MILQNTPILFSEALSGNRPVFCDGKGHWNMGSFFQRTFYRFFGSKEKNLIAILRAANLCFKNFENFENRCAFNGEVKSSLQTKDFDQWLSVSEILITKSRSISSSAINEEISLLLQQSIALKYRLEVVSHLRLKSQSPDSNLLQQVTKIAEAWMKKQWFFKEKKEEEKLALLKKVCTKTPTYPIFAEHLISDPRLQDEFFTWSLRYKGKISPFIEFPATSKKIVGCNLLERVANDLKVEKLFDPIIKKIFKDLTLPFEGIRRSLLDENEKITFSHNYTLSFKQIFEMFKERFYTMGNLEYFSKRGFTNWNSLKLGPYNPITKSYESISLDTNDWYTNLIPTHENISPENLSAKLKNNCDGINWAVTLLGTNAYEKIGVEGTHSYLEFAIPSLDGKYSIYPIGKYAKDFPHSLRENLKVIFDTVPGALMIPDENCYNGRDRGGISQIISPEAGFKLMEKIRKNLLNIRQGNFYFQMFNHNCIQWSLKKFGKIHPSTELTKNISIGFWDTHPTGDLKTIFGKIKKLCPFLREKIMNIFTRIFRPTSKTYIKKNGEKRVISLKNSKPWERMAKPSPHPGMLLRSGEIKFNP